MKKTISFKGTNITIEDKVNVDDVFPNFKATNKDLSDFNLEDYRGKVLVINAFPSVDTGVCAVQTTRFNQEIKNYDNAVVITVSKDLPFALDRFCGAEGLKNVVNLSDFRGSFSDDYQLTITDGPLKGLASRVVIILDENAKILYTEQVPEIKEEPDYQKALAVLK